jgi:hypothetical protein
MKKPTRSTAPKAAPKTQAPTTHVMTDAEADEKLDGLRKLLGQDQLEADLRSCKISAEEAMGPVREVLFQLAECLPEHLAVIAYAARSGAEEGPIREAKDAIMSALADLSKLTQALASIAITATPKAAEVTA